MRQIKRGRSSDRYPVAAMSSLGDIFNRTLHEFQQSMSPSVKEIPNTKHVKNASLSGRFWEHGIADALCVDTRNPLKIMGVRLPGQGVLIVWSGATYRLSNIFEEKADELSRFSKEMLSS